MKPPADSEIVRFMERRGWVYRVEGVLYKTSTGARISESDAVKSYFATRFKEGRL